MTGDIRDGIYLELESKRLAHEREHGPADSFLQELDLLLDAVVDMITEEMTRVLDA